MMISYTLTFVYCGIATGDWTHGKYLWGDHLDHSAIKALSSTSLYLQK